jgi:plasmid segregation protein ParM
MLFGTNWHKLAQTGTSWHKLAEWNVDLYAVWHKLAQIGTSWHKLAEWNVDLCAVWHKLAQSGTSWHKMQSIKISCLSFVLYYCLEHKRQFIWRERRMDMQKIIVRGIDSGFGFIKYTEKVEGINNVTYNKFPSIAVRKVGSGSSALDATSANLNAVDVMVGKEIFTVGPEAHLETGNNSDPRILHEDYVERPEYLALYYGALFFMGVSHIDFLVVGLPVSLVTSKKEVLIEKLTGTHEILPGRFVTIANVVVMPQPLGSLMSHAFSQGREVYQNIKQEMSLIPDPGYKTFDWVLVSGFRPIGSRSGSHLGGGMREILNVIADDMQNKGVTKNRYKNFERLDAAIVTGKLNLPSQKGYDLTPHIEVAKSTIVEEAVQKMYGVAGDGDDIDNIVLAGGPAKLFYDAIKRAYPSHNIIIAEDNQFANVKGYFSVGVEKAKGYIVSNGLDAAIV